MKKILYLVVLAVVCASCEKNITLDLPQGESKIVVDGYVETGLPPYIVLSRSAGYFDPINASAINNLPESGARILISDGLITVAMKEIDTTINGTVLRGIYAPLDSATNFPLMFGTPGRIYSIAITTMLGEKVYSSAKLQLPVTLDSTWFKVQENKDSLGFAWAHLTDPDTLGNCYRWFAKRIGKDDLFLAPFGSAVEDKFINGKSFDFGYNRGKIQNSLADDDNNIEDGFFKKGDTIVVKFCAIDRSTFEFWRDAETQMSNNGSPFAVPSNVKSNINGGLGIFATYSPVYDTIFAK